MFCAVLKVATLGWLAYFSLIGVALLLAAGIEGAVLRLRHVDLADLRGPGRRVVGRLATICGTLSSALLLVGLLVYAASSLWASALFRPYPQWQVASDVEARYMQALTACVATTPEVSYVSLQQVPGSFEDGSADTVMLGVTLVEQYTAESALRLAFPLRTLNVHADSFATLHEPAPNVQFSCTRLPQGVEFAAAY